MAVREGYGFPCQKCGQARAPTVLVRGTGYDLDARRVCVPVPAGSVGLMHRQLGHGHEETDSEGSAFFCAWHRDSPKDYPEEGPHAPTVLVRGMGTDGATRLRVARPRPRVPGIRPALLPARGSGRGCARGEP